MYSQLFWDELYRLHYDDAPWMNDSWKGPLFQTLTSDVQMVLHGNLKGASLLDYGCGNGHIGLHFASMGMLVDLADISSVLIEKLRAKLLNQRQVQIYQLSEPKQLPQGKMYDIIIAWNLFHHIDPVNWTHILSQFADIMKMGSHMMISGWDESDQIIRDDNGLARYTNNPTWCINQLPDYTNGLPLFVKSDKLVRIQVPQFAHSRHFRYIIFCKTKV